MSLPRHIIQPGPVDPNRIQAIEARGQRLNLTLEPGLLLVEAVRRAFARHGFVSGVAELDGVGLSPFTYVMPALSKTAANAAFYSDYFRPAGLSRIDSGAMTFGLRDGAAFFHCHALWREADGTSRGGHIIPEETVVAEAITIPALGITDALFEAQLDPEINFKVFGPVAAPPAAPAPEAYRRVVALRLKPNQDFCTTLESWCAAHGIRNARLRGGVGSTIGARFTDGRVVENFATEVFIRSGTIAPDPTGEGLVCTAGIGLVDYTGATAEGILRRGDNPVLMTFELALDIEG